MVKNFASKELWNKIYNRFENEICKNCFDCIPASRSMTFPEPIPFIGPNYFGSKHRLMFVGIETYSRKTKRESRDKIGYEKFKTEQIENLFYGKKESGIKYSPFWEWIRVISTKVFSTDLATAFSQIAYSNLHKCQARKIGSDPDDSNYQLVKNLSRKCIKEAAWIFHEIEEIKPKNIIIFAGRKENCWLARLLLNNSDENILTKFNYDNYKLSIDDRRKRKNRDLFVHIKDGDRRFIITNHPQGTPNEIREEIIKIIKQDYWTAPEHAPIEYTLRF